MGCQQGDRSARWPVPAGCLWLALLAVPTLTARHRRPHRRDLLQDLSRPARRHCNPASRRELGLNGAADNLTKYAWMRVRCRGSWGLATTRWPNWLPACGAARGIALAPLVGLVVA